MTVDAALKEIADKGFDLLELTLTEHGFWCCTIAVPDGTLTSCNVGSTSTENALRVAIASLENMQWRRDSGVEDARIYEEGLKDMAIERTPAEEQTWIRIRCLVAAFAYEEMSDPIMSDAEFDAMCQRVDLSIPTNRPDMDEWFRTHFDPSTGMWIKRLPRQELDRAANIYYRHHAPKEVLEQRLKEVVAEERKAKKPAAPPKKIHLNVELLKQVLIFDF